MQRDVHAHTTSTLPECCVTSQPACCERIATRLQCAGDQLIQGGILYMAINREHQAAGLAGFLVEAALVSHVMQPSD